MATKRNRDTIEISRRNFTIGMSAVVGSICTYGASLLVPSVPASHRLPSPTPQSNMGSSLAIVAAELVEKELQRGLYFLPTLSPAKYFDINQKYFQLGLLNTCASVVKSMAQYTLNKGFSSRYDVDLSNAASYFDYTKNHNTDDVLQRPKIIANFRAGCDTLRNYNSGVLAGKSRPIDQVNFLDDMTCFAINNMHYLHGELTRAVETGPLMSLEHQALYFKTRGSVYGYYALYRGAEQDCFPVVQKMSTPGREHCFYRTLQDLHKICMNSDTPRFVTNGSKDSYLIKDSDLKTLADDIKAVRNSLDKLSERTGSKPAQLLR